MKLVRHALPATCLLTIQLQTDGSCEVAAAAVVGMPPIAMTMQPRACGAVHVLIEKAGFGCSLPSSKKDGCTIRDTHMIYIRIFDITYAHNMYNFDEYGILQWLA